MWLLGLLQMGALGCQRERAVVVVDARSPVAASPPVAAPPVAPPPAVAPPGAPLDDGSGLTTLEISGMVELPAGGRLVGQVFVLVAKGDCLAPGNQPLRRMPATEDAAFLLHVLAAPGTELSLCAYLESPKRPGVVLPVVVYGKAARTILVEKKGDQVLRDVTISLVPAAPRSFVGDVSKRSGSAATR